MNRASSIFSGLKNRTSAAATHIIMNSRDIFNDLGHRSIKVDTYFPIYDAELAKYRGQRFTLVEIGVNQGGSLFMWRKLFPLADIIGVDLDPAAAKMRQHGFRIFIGDQTKPEFWKEFYKKTGPVDVLIDDGAHTNKAQIVTIAQSLKWIRDGGLILVEDCHTSFEPRNGNPHRYSFLNYAHHIAGNLYARFGLLPRNIFSDAVYKVLFYESIVCLHIDRRKCLRSHVVQAGAHGIGAQPSFHEDKRLIKSRTIRDYAKQFPRVAAVYNAINSRIIRWRSLRENRALAKYFR